MRVYRIVRADRVSLDGKGAAEYPGRWNQKEIPCVYTSSTPALAQLEVMANVEDWKIFINVPHVVQGIAIPDNRIIDVTDADLPSGWAEAVYHPETQALGSRLLRQPEVLAFSVPSAVSKTERNFILNPRAKDFEKLVRVESQSSFELDERLLRVTG